MLLLQSTSGGNLSYLDWIEKWTSIFESVAVIVSVIYVAIQIKLNTKAVRSATYQNIISNIAAIEARISEDKELARVFRVGRRGERLEPDEQLRFNELMSSFFNFHENLHYQYRQHLLDEDLWKGWNENLSLYLSRPGCRAWWDGTAHLYSKNFREYVDSLKLKVKVKSSEDILGTGSRESSRDKISDGSATETPKKATENR